jgi:hypothetical protein
VDTLGWHASATLYAEAHYMGVSRGPARVAELAKQARSWRALLLQDMALMVTRRLLPVEKHAQLKIQACHKDLPFLLLAVTQVYRDAWPKLSDYTSVSPQELDEASRIAEEFSLAFARSTERNAGLSEANDQRRRNFTLLAQAYDQVRRGLSYLRWSEGDTDEIAPSLYRGRGGSRRKSKSPAAAPDG